MVASLACGRGTWGGLEIVRVRYCISINYVAKTATVSEHESSGIHNVPGHAACAGNISRDRLNPSIPERIKSRCDGVWLPFSLNDTIRVMHRGRFPPPQIP